MKNKDVNFFLAGPGSVGKSFLELILQKREILSKTSLLKFSLKGISNSKSYSFSTDLNETNYKSYLNHESGNYEAAEFVQKIINYDSPNKVFIDSTADDIFTVYYIELLRNHVSIVTPNKIALTKSQKYYNELIGVSNAGKSKFRYGANVGAGLPIIYLIQDMVKYGDKITEIEGVFSGTLSYVFNMLHRGNDFSSIVKEAKKREFTEPNPKHDLTGLDMGRKLLILLREAGFKYELNDIEIESLVPTELEKVENSDEFIEKLKNYNSYFNELQAKAYKNNSRLIYTAKFDENNINLRMREVHESSPIYSITFNQNIFLIRSDYYAKNPLVLQGRGAGTRFTASGMLADCVRIFA